MGKSVGKVIILVVLAAGIGAGVFFGCQAAYKNGYELGHNAGITESESKIDDLAAAVVAKNDVLKILEKIKAPETVTGANVDDYLKQIDAAVAELREKNEVEIADLLDTYKDAWKDFKVVYASKDNELIKSELSKTKTAHEEFVEKTQTILDGRIETVNQ